MAKSNSITSSFNFDGELGKVSYKKKKIKYIKLETEREQYWVKIPKKLRKQISKLSIGSQLQVQGLAKQNKATGKIKYKAQMIVVVPIEPLENAIQPKTKTVSLQPVFDSKVKSKAKVLICQKSNCWKKGGKQVCAEIESKLEDLGLTKDIPIKKTGCLSQCKKAPALVMMPDKARYSKVKPKQVAKMVKKHLIG